MQTKFLISLLVILLSILTVKNTWDFYFSASNNSLNNILRKSVIEQSEINIELLEKNKNLENEIRSMQNNLGFAESYSRENLDMVFPNEILTSGAAQFDVIIGTDNSEYDELMFGHGGDDLLKAYGGTNYICL